MLDLRNNDMLKAKIFNDFIRAFTLSVVYYNVLLYNIRFLKTSTVFKIDWLVCFFFLLITFLLLIYHRYLFVTIL